jgi:hypothetical protein
MFRLVEFNGGLYRLNEQTGEVFRLSHTSDGEAWVLVKEPSGQA